MPLHRPYTIHESISNERAHFLTDETVAALGATHVALATLTEQLAPSLQDRRYSAVVTDSLPGTLPAFVVNHLTYRWAAHKRVASPQPLSLKAVLEDPGCIGLQPRGREARALLVTDVVRESATGLTCERLKQSFPDVDVAGLQTYWNDPGYYHRYWEQHNLPLQDTRIFPGLQGSDHGTLLQAPVLELASGYEPAVKPGPDDETSGAETPPITRYEAQLGAVTTHEHQLIMDVARDHLVGIAMDLYAVHFPPFREEE